MFNINYLATPDAENDSCDQDGSGFSVGQGDCDDSDSKYFPGRFEILNSIDDDCDGDIDEGTLAFDDDGDGFTEHQGDCDDNNSDTYPGASIQESASTCMGFGWRWVWSQRTRSKCDYGTITVIQQYDLPWCL